MTRNFKAWDNSSDMSESIVTQFATRGNIGKPHIYSMAWK